MTGTPIQNLIYYKYYSEKYIEALYIILRPLEKQPKKYVCKYQGDWANTEIQFKYEKLKLQFGEFALPKFGV